LPALKFAETFCILTPLACLRYAFLLTGGVQTLGRKQYAYEAEIMLKKDPKRKECQVFQALQFRNICDKIVPQGKLCQIRKDTEAQG